jgi:hypothetical protein
MSTRHYTTCSALILAASIIVPASYWLQSYTLTWPFIHSRVQTVGETPYHVQAFNNDPMVLYIRDFLSKDELSHIIRSR